MQRYALAVAVLMASTSAQAAINISTQPTQNMSCSGGVCTATAAKAILNVSDLAKMLAAGDTTVKSGSIAQDIDIKAAITWAGPSGLTLDSYHSISFEKPLIVAGSSGLLTIATNDGGTGGDFAFSGKGHVEYSDISNPWSRLTINGDSYYLVKNVHGLIRALKRSKRIALAKSYNAAKDGVYAHPITGNADLYATFEGLGNSVSNYNLDTRDGYVGFIGITAEYSDAQIRDFSLLSATIKSESNDGSLISVGLLVGVLQEPYDAPVIVNCKATGTVTAGDNVYLGGLAGELVGGAVSRGQAAAVVIGGRSSSVGGLIGYNDHGVISESYATGNVSGGENAYVGGVLGQDRAFLDTDVKASYSTGKVTGGDAATVGGLVGAATYDPNRPGANYIDQVYSTSAVSGGSGALLGGLLGSYGFANYQVAHTDWDLDTSDISDPSQGIGNIPNAPGVTGLTDAQLKSGLPAGFDPHVWGQSPDINNGYPYLLANPPPKNAPAKVKARH